MKLQVAETPSKFSLNERERRWQTIRALMLERNLGILVATGNTGRYNRNKADARYITQIGGFEVDVHAILPLEGEVRAPYGIVQYAVMKRLQKYFPHATFLDATNL